MRDAVYRAAERHFASIHGQDTMEEYTSPDGCKGRRNLAMYLAVQWCADHLSCADVDGGGWQASIVPAVDDE